LDRYLKPVEYARAGMPNFWRVERDGPATVHMFGLGVGGDGSSIYVPRAVALLDDLLVGPVGDEVVLLAEPGVEGLLGEPVVGEVGDEAPGELVGHEAEGAAVEGAEPLEADGALAGAEPQEPGLLARGDADLDGRGDGAGFAAQPGHGVGPAGDLAAVVGDDGAGDDGAAAAGGLEVALAGDVVEGALDGDEAGAELAGEVRLGGEELAGAEVAADALEEAGLDLGVEGRGRRLTFERHAQKIYHYTFYVKRKTMSPFGPAAAWDLGSGISGVARAAPGQYSVRTLNGPTGPAVSRL